MSASRSSDDEGRKAAGDVPDRIEWTGLGAAIEGAGVESVDRTGSVDCEDGGGIDGIANRSDM